MQPTYTSLPRRLRQQLATHQWAGNLYDVQIQSLADYFAVCNDLLKGERTYWFRGHGNIEWKLIPSALRDKSARKRTQALQLIQEFKRLAPLKLDRPSQPTDELEWVQLAQHYGLPTRLLDWTENAAIGLYFACVVPETNGAVFVLNPIELNQLANPKRPRILTIHEDRDLINKYLGLGGSRTPGLRTIAIKPVMNTARILLQRGAFTLHGSNRFGLTSQDAATLIYIPILSDFKPALLKELSRVGVDEMSIFPEPEHVCSHLRQTISQ